MAATLTTTPGAPSTSLQRLHHVEKVVSRTSLSVCLSVCFSLDACFSAIAKSFRSKESLQARFSLRTLHCCATKKEGKKKLLFGDRSFGAVML